MDAEELLLGNIRLVFNEHDPDRRMSALRTLWSDTASMFEAEEKFEGRQSISDNVGALLARLPAGTQFTPIGRPVVNHEAALLHWAAGANPDVPAVTGTDVAFVRDGKIETLYVFLNPRGK